MYSELADFERVEDWDAAVEFVANTGDPSAQALAANDWYRLRRKLEIIKVGWSFFSRVCKLSDIIISSH